MEQALAISILFNTKCHHVLGIAQKYTENMNNNDYKALLHNDCQRKCFLFPQICVEHCDTKIRFIELQLIRVETCGCAEGYSREGKQPIFDNITIPLTY